MCPAPTTVRLLAAIALVPVLLAAPAAAEAPPTDHQPDFTEDEWDGDLSVGDRSLREAFFLAQQDAGDSTVTLAPGATYLLTCIGAQEGPLLHNPTTATALRVVGNGATIEQTCPDHRVLSISAPELELEELTVTGGDAPANGGGVSIVGDITVTDSVITGNTDQHTADNGGGGIMAQGDVTIIRSLISDNEARKGGAVATVAGGDITVVDSAIVGNTATSTISALDAGGDLTITSSTVGANVGPGPATASVGDTTLQHATVAGNEATNAGFASRGVYVLSDLVATHSVVAANTVDAGSCFVSGTTTSNGHNVEGDTSCGFTDSAGGDQQGVADPRIGPVRDNGGELPTMFPLWGSPLVDAVPLGECLATLPIDPRGVARPFPGGGACDIGAVEAVYPPHGLSDVPPWVEAAVRWITSDVNAPPIMAGFADGTFRPDDAITRAQVVRLLHREAGSPGPHPPHALSDVPAWVEDAVRWAVDTQIMTGYADDTFRPGDSITRAAVVRAKHRLAGEPAVTGLPPHGLSDVPPWVDTAVTWAMGHELVNGFSDGTFRPMDAITRAQVARMDHRLATNPDAWADPGTAPPTLPFVAPP